MTLWKDIVNSLSQLWPQTNETTTDGSNCMLIKSMCFKSACREPTSGSTRYSVWFPVSNASHQIPACATTHIFHITNAFVSFMNPSFSTGLKQQVHLLKLCHLPMCHVSTPEYPPYMIICCQEYYSQKMAKDSVQHNIQECLLQCRFLGPPPDWLHQNLRGRDLKICTFTPAPQMTF